MLNNHSLVCIFNSLTLSSLPGKTQSLFKSSYLSTSCLYHSVHSYRRKTYPHTNYSLYIHGHQTHMGPECFLMIMIHFTGSITLRCSPVTISYTWLSSYLWCFLVILTLGLSSCFTELPGTIRTDLPQVPPPPPSTHHICPPSYIWAFITQDGPAYALTTTTTTIRSLTTKDSKCSSRSADGSALPCSYSGMQVDW